MIHTVVAAKACKARQTQRLDARELAYALDAVVSAGLVARAARRCLGAHLVSRLSIGYPPGSGYVRHSPGSGDFTVAMRPVAGIRAAYAELASAVLHGRAGHDAGCYAFGVALSELRVLAWEWGAPGAARYIGEAFRVAADNLAAGTGWQADLAADAIASALSQRITLRRPERDSVGAIDAARRAYTTRRAVLARWLRRRTARCV